MSNTISGVEPTKVNVAALHRFFDFVGKLDGDLAMLVGASFYTDNISILDRSNGKHIFFVCPGEGSYRSMKAVSLLLVISLSKFFTLNRVIISPSYDPCRCELKADYYHYYKGGVKNLYPLPDGNYIVQASYEEHPYWRILQIVDEDGYIKR